MKKIALLSAALLGITASAQETDSLQTKKNWSITGQNSLTLNQAAFSNWVGGGANNVGWIAGSNYNLTYEKDKNLWENFIILGYGQNNTKGIGTRKTQDIIHLSTNYGRKISKSWYASGGVSVQSQFAPGYDYNNSTKILGTKTDNDGNRLISNFMAPGYIMAGVGFTYKPSNDLTVTLRPANARWTVVMDKSLQRAGNFGLKNDGDSSLFQFGFSASAVYKVPLMDNITLLNSASVFSNYLEHPERLVLGYNGALNMKINKYISTILTLDLVYDHNQIKKMQMRETLGVGLSYNIDNGIKRSENKHNQTWK
ncbi:DUF3078 domain-containing protein [Bergeyella zoohelcum]|uniref:DUF3078 domain-containing protein n=1 Tax=Bergeyella zoohelcum ATCC 43767 TaxID=883096 RepID=K1LFM6_9FLAO|nr:DUF3078 domain-containing protein [Bergeyella zoohelcum]EKB55460.1 hypothetical protein HMPREF9699_01774 [Bergeyella zoohelcum ATCC 43767]SUV50147.1 Protein of uncharacterised function (DUF3078) [Bergeyella zoohelcum]